MTQIQKTGAIQTYNTEIEPIRGTAQANYSSVKLLPFHCSPKQGRDASPKGEKQAPGGGETQANYSSVKLLPRGLHSCN
jgi:hypothetical protein